MNMTLIQGPPGTGKTRTIIGAISGILARGRGSRVLVAAHSNAAIDETVSRISRFQIYEKDGKKKEPLLVRVGKNSTSLQFSLEDLVAEDKKKDKNISKSDLEKRRLQRTEIVVSTLSGCGGAHMKKSLW